MSNFLRSGFARAVACRFAFGRQLLLSFLLLLTGFNAVAQLQLVYDVNNQHAPEDLTDFDYTRLTDVDGTLYFVVKNTQLWKTTGITAVLLREFDAVENLTNVNGTLYFTATTPDHGSELWKSDGTASGTTLVRDIRAGVDGSGPQELTNVGGVVYFSANDGLTGRELWKSDGTLTGTVRVKDILRVVGSSNPANLVAVSGVLYFTANNGQQGYELWRSDGTDAGTYLLKDIRPEQRVSSQPKLLTNVNGVLFFSAVDGSTVRSLWKSDGTTVGTVKVSLSPYNPRLLTAVGSTVFFTGQDTHGTELWKSDGTEAGTVLVKDLTPGPGSATGYATPHISYLTSANGKLYFLSVTSVPNTIYSPTQNLWVSDGTEAGTVRLTEYPEIVFSFINPFITPFGGLTYFTGTGENGGLELFRTNGTPEGETLFIDNIAAAYTSEAKLTVSGSYLYYVGQGNLWRTDGTNTSAIAGIGSATESSDPLEITDGNGNVYFSAHNGIAHGLWKSDGTESGTMLISYFSDRLHRLTISGNYLYYLANTVDDSDNFTWKLWRTNLTNNYTEQVSNINPGADDQISEIVDVNGTVFFSVEQQSGEGQLWKTNGTIAGTQLLRSFNTFGQPPIALTHVNGTLFFSALEDFDTGAELWKSDGTVAGTVMVKDIFPAPGESGEPHQLVNVNNTLFFIAYDGDYELWKSDGTNAGTVQVKDIRTDDEAVADIGELTDINGTLYFTSADELDETTGFYNRAVWKSDGTEAGTVKVATFPGHLDIPTTQGLYLLHAIDGDVIVALRTNTLHEIWRIDEATATTEELAEISNFQAVGFNDLAVLNGVIYFNGHISSPTEFNAHLWRTDGTACGTFVVATEGRPEDLTVSGGKLFMAATSPVFGREPHILNEAGIEDPCDATMAGGGADQAPAMEMETFSTQRVSSFPNPFAGDFTLNVSGKDGDAYAVKILNASGTHMEQYNLQYNRDYNLGADWGPGVYLLHVKKENGMTVKKVIKTR